MSVDGTLQEIIGITQKLRRPAKEIIQYTSLYYSPCQKYKTFLFYSNWQQIMLLCIQSPYQTGIGYTTSDKNQDLFDSIPQTNCFLDISDIKEIKMPQNANELIITFTNMKKHQKIDEWNLKFATEQLRNTWTNRLYVLKKNHFQSSHNLIKVLNMNLAVRRTIQSPGLEDSNSSRKQSEIWKIVQQFGYSFTKLASELELREKQIIRSNEAQIQKLGTEFRTLQKTLSNITNQNISLISKLEGSKRQNEMLLNDLKQSHNRISESQRLLQKTDQQKLQITFSLSKSEKEKKDLEQQLRSLSQKHLYLKKDVEEKQQKLLQTQASLVTTEQREKRMKEYHQQQSAQKQIEIQQLAKKLHQMIEQNKRFSADLQQIAQQIQAKDEQLQQLTQQLQAKDEQLQHLTQQLQAKDELLAEYKCRLHFDGDILDLSQSAQKRFMVQQIEQYTNNQIVGMKRRYHVDPFNNTSFHQYIDDVQNICLLIKLKNGNICAGFSVCPISEHNIANKGGIIMSVTNKMCFKLIEGKRSVTYDKFFLIFGNSELRLKHGEKKFFTNFAVANGFYIPKGEKHTILTGKDTEKEVELETFEVFEIKFKNNMQ